MNHRGGGREQLQDVVLVQSFFILAQVRLVQGELLCPTEPQTSSLRVHHNDGVVPSDHCLFQQLLADICAEISILVEGCTATNVTVPPTARFAGTAGRNPYRRPIRNSSPIQPLPSKSR